MTMCGYTDRKYYFPSGIGISNDIFGILNSPSAYKLNNGDTYLWNKKLPSSKDMKCLGYFKIEEISFMYYEYDGNINDIENEIASYQN